MYLLQNIKQQNKKLFFVAPLIGMLCFTKYSRFAFEFFTPSLFTGMIAISIFNARRDGQSPVVKAYYSNDFIILANCYVFGAILQNVVLPWIINHKAVEIGLKSIVLTAGLYMQFISRDENLSNEPWNKNITAALLSLVAIADHNYALWYFTGMVMKYKEIKTELQQKFDNVNYTIPVSVSLSALLSIISIFRFINLSFITDFAYIYLLTQYFFDGLCYQTLNVSWHPRIPIHPLLIAPYATALFCCVCSSRFKYDLINLLSKFNIGSIGFNNPIAAINTLAIALFAYESHTATAMIQDEHSFFAHGGFNLWPYMALLIAENVFEGKPRCSIWKRLPFYVFSIIATIGIVDAIKYQQITITAQGEYHIVDGAQEENMKPILLGNFAAITSNIVLSALNCRIVGLDLICGMLAMEYHRTF